MREIANNGKMILFDREIDSEGWCNLKLVRIRSQNHYPKCNWWLAWNGERLARSRDCYLLLTHWPRDYEWVIEVLRNG
jgi:hypothetical protein